MRAPRRITIILAGFAALATTIAVPAHALAAPRAAAAPSLTSSEHCNDVEFIGARGSGQSYSTFRGLGPEVDKMVTVVQKALHAKGITYGTDAVPYPAVSVDVLKPSAFELMLIENPMTTDAGLAYYYVHNVRTFLNSIATGVSDTIFDADDFHAVCPPTVFVFVGYSQGAMVMHQAENQLDAHHHGTFKAIAGTILLADGNRVPDTRAKEFGTSAHNGEGVQTYLTPMSSHPDVPAPGSTANICNAGDIVCNFNLHAVEHASAAAKVHTSYAVCTKTGCTYERVLTTASSWVAGVVIRRLIG